jgi:hypothetical protein
MSICRVALVAADTRSAAAHAADIDAAGERMIAFVSGCSDKDWRTAPLSGDPRPVAVVVDHVAHAQEYLAGWMRQIVAGQRVEVNSDAVGALNARHARDAVAVSQVEATEHLRRSGAAVSTGYVPPALPGRRQPGYLLRRISRRSAERVSAEAACEIRHKALPRNVMDVATRPRRPEAPGSRHERTFSVRDSMHKYSGRAAACWPTAGLLGCPV